MNTEILNQDMSSDIYEFRYTNSQVKSELMIHELDFLNLDEFISEHQG